MHATTPLSTALSFASAKYVLLTNDLRNGRPPLQHSLAGIHEFRFHPTLRVHHEHDDDPHDVHMALVGLKRRREEEALAQRAEEQKDPLWYIHSDHPPKKKVSIAAWDQATAARPLTHRLASQFNSQHQRFVHSLAF